MLDHCKSVWVPYSLERSTTHRQSRWMELAHREMVSEQSAGFVETLSQMGQRMQKLLTFQREALPVIAL